MQGRSEFEGSPFEYSGRTFWQNFARSAQEHPDNIALICTHQPKGQLNIPNTDLDDNQFRRKPYLRIKYRHLADAVDRYANALLEHGVQPDTTFFSFMPNLVEYSIAMWAAFKLGCIWVPINPKNLLNQEEAAHMIKLALDWKSAKSSLVLVVDGKTADLFDELNIEYQLKKMIASSETRDTWENFSDTFLSAPPSHPRNPSFATEIGKSSLVMYTSGTTSLPKGIGRPSGSMELLIEQKNFDSQPLPEDIFCVVAPNNHAVGMVWHLSAQGHGATVVHPGPAFDPQLVMDTMLRESCTHVTLVPTMVYALLAVKSTRGGKIPSLQLIALGGSVLTPEVVDICLNEIGSKRVENIYGMTEGCLLSPNGKAIHSFIEGDLVSAGYASAGSKIRVCAPNSKTPLPIGKPGELHFSGLGVTPSYINKVTSDFYDDPKDGTRWFITGDGATIDERGRVFITGRFKEMIIRGGENISPMAIEAVLGKVSELVSLNIQIVGARDTVAGEVPVAIYVGGADVKAAQRIQQTIVSQIGPAHVPDQVIALEELGLNDYPRTMAGKVQKNKLAKIVQDFRDREQSSTGDGDLRDTDLARIVRKIWTRSLGFEVDETLPIASFADSLTIMKTRDMIMKETGKQMSLGDMVEAGNISGQIKVLQQQTQEAQARKPKRRGRNGPVTKDDVVVFRHKSAAFEGSKAFIESILAKYKYSWSDVADITPAYDYSTLLNKTGIMDSWSFTLAFMTKTHSMSDARIALRKVLANSPVFTSFFVWNENVFQTDSALHIIMRQTDDYLDQRIHDYGTIKTISELQALSEAYPDASAALIPGPLVDAYLVFVEETQTTALLMRLHHAILDASSALIFSDDLESAFGRKPLPEHIAYNTWADSNYSLRDSLEAKLAVDWHINRLRGVASHRDAVWITPESDDTCEEMVQTTFEVPSILALRRTYPSISAPVILKTAFSLVNSYRSKHTHALFANHQASREQFPFIPAALSADLGYDYSAANVAGPTIEDVVNLVEIRPEEKVLEFLGRMQTEQNDLTKFAAAPIGDVINGLGDTDGPMVLDTIRNMIFNWVPGLGSRSPNKYDHIELIAAVVRPEIALNVNIGLGGDKGSTVFMDLTGVGVTQEEHWRIAKEIEQVTCWICDESNWNAKVGGFTQSLKNEANVINNNVTGLNGHA